MSNRVQRTGQVRQRVLLWVLAGLGLVALAGVVGYVLIPPPEEQRWEAARDRIAALGCKVELSVGEATVESCKDLDDEKLRRLIEQAQVFRSVLLDLQGTRVSAGEVGRLGALTNLRQLDLTGLPLTNDSLQGLASLKKLEQLHLTRTGIGDEGLRHLKSLTALGRLFLDGNPTVTSAGLEQLLALEQLHDLRLSGTRVDDTGLRRLAQLKQLTTLWLRDVPDVTLGGIAELKKALPDLQVRR